MTGVRFETQLLSQGNNTGIEVPPAELEELGGGKRPAVTVSVSSTSASAPVVEPFVYRSTVASNSGLASPHTVEGDSGCSTAVDVPVACSTTRIFVPPSSR